MTVDEKWDFLCMKHDEFLARGDSYLTAYALAQDELKAEVTRRAAELTTTK